MRFKVGAQVCLSHRHDVTATLLKIERTGGNRIATIEFPDGSTRALSVKGIRVKPTEAEILSRLRKARGWSETKVRSLAEGNALSLQDVYDAVFNP